MSDATLTRDAFLGGQLMISQPKRGYRAGIDPVLLAASVTATAGQSVLELGCGVGVAALCLAARVPGLDITGVEVQPDYAALAQRNAASNNLRFNVVIADLAKLPADLRQRRFDHVIANPPYFDRQTGPQANNPGREFALGETTPLEQWLENARKRLRDGGRMTLIQRVDRLPACLAGLDHRMGSVIVRPLAARPGRSPDLFLLQATKGGRAKFRLLAPIYLHSGGAHSEGPKDYTATIAAVLSKSARLDAFSP